MPFKSEKQRRWMYRNNPALARKWQKNYKDGGYVCSDVPSFADGGYVNSTALNMKDGGEVTRSSNPRRRSDPHGRYKDRIENFTVRDILEFVPIIGDILAAEEVYRELKKDPVNWVVVGILTGGTIIGFIPGVGDAAAAAIRKGARLLKENTNSIVAAVKSTSKGGKYSDDEIETTVERLMSGGNAEAVKAENPELFAIVQSELLAFAKQGGVVRTAGAEYGARAIGKANTLMGALKSKYPDITESIAVDEIDSADDLLIILHELGHAKSPLGVASPQGIVGLGESFKLAEKGYRRPTDVVQGEYYAWKDVFNTLDREGLELSGGLLEGARESFSSYIDNVVVSNGEVFYDGVKQNITQPELAQYLTDSMDKTRLVQSVDPTGKVLVRGNPVEVGARPKKTRTITVDYPDGTSTELTGDSAAQAIADATGKPLKTVQNRLSEGKPIVGDDGTIYSEKGKVENELIDTRESTYGQIDGYDGTFSDLMREHGIDPKSSEADAIRKRLARGQEWNGYKRSDVEDYDVRHDQLKEEQKAKGKATKAANMVKRIQNAGLDSNNPELVSEFTSVWNLPVKKGLSSLSSGSAESAIRVAREQASNDAYREYISRPKVKEKMDKYKLEYKDLMDRKPDFYSPNDPLKEQGMSFQFEDWELEASELAKAMNEVVNPALAAARQAGDSAAYREFQEQLGKKAAKDPQFTQWRKFFLKYAPEKINHLKTAQEQRQEIYRILMGSYIGNPG